MRGLFTGIAVVVLTVVVLLFTGGGVFDIFRGLFDNKDVGTIVGIVAVFLYAAFVVQVGIVLAVLLGAVVNALFDNQRR